MAGNDPNVLTPLTTTYTFDEAIEYMRMKDKSPTDIFKPTTTWVNSKTGEKIIIGYNN